MYLQAPTLDSATALEATKCDGIVQCVVAVVEIAVVPDGILVTSAVGVVVVVVTSLVVSIIARRQQLVPSHMSVPLVVHPPNLVVETESLDPNT